MDTGNLKKAYLFIFITALLWASMEVSLKFAGNNMDAFQLTAVRFAIGGILLLPFAAAEIKKRGLKLKIKDFLYLALVGTICVPVSMVLLQL